MKVVQKTILAAVIIAVGYACGDTEANDKMAQLDSLKSQMKELKAEISALEGELRASGQLETPVGNKVLVTTIELAQQPFHHKIEVRGAVESRKNVMLTAEAMGSVTEIRVAEGERVKKGQLLLVQDAAVLLNNIEELKKQLELAEIVFNKQANLWEQNIGTEIQYLQAKNNKESLERKLSTLRSQLKMSKVHAPFDGVVDDIPVRVGELAQPGMPVIRLVNPKAMYLLSDVSEAYLGRFEAGDEVDVFFPSQNKRLTSTVASVGEVINSQNRTFQLEVKMPGADFPVKPNQVVVLKLVDYENENALVVPTKLIQRDSRGSYVYEIVKEGDKSLARKSHVVVGVSYDNQTEILSGMTAGQKVANKGYRELGQDVMVEITK